MRTAVLATAIVFHLFVFGNCVRSRATPLENFNSESAANALEHNEADEADEGTRLDTVTLHGPILSSPPYHRVFYMVFWPEWGSEGHLGRDSVEVDVEPHPTPPRPGHHTGKASYQSNQEGGRSSPQASIAEAVAKRKAQNQQGQLDIGENLVRATRRRRTI